MSAPSSIELTTFASWFRDELLPVLREMDPDQSAEWEAELAKLEEEAQANPPEVPVCFLGMAGIGKSTLVNALAGGTESVLPAGGVGPLTAQALQVKHGLRSRFVVRYHDAGRVHQLDFGLRKAFARELGASPNDPLPSPADMDDSGEGVAVDSSGMSKRDFARKEASLMLKGPRPTGENSIAYLVAGLRSVVNESGAGLDRLEPDDRSRAERLREALRLASAKTKYSRNSDADAEEYQLELYEHATGFLSPLISQMTVEVPSQALRDGLGLVDLPGVGVANDIRQAITAKWIREQARAVVLVTDRAGITHAVADLLRSTEFLNRLLHASESPQDDPVGLFVAVTRVDDVALQRFHDKSPKDKKPRAGFFADLRLELCEMIRQQLAEMLPAVFNQGGELSDVQRRVIDRVSADAQIYPLSAIEYRKILQDDDDERSFLRSTADTGVPGLLAGLQELASGLRASWLSRRRQRVENFASRVLGWAESVVPRALAEKERVAEEARNLRESFREMLTAKNREYHLRQGRFGEFWINTLPQLVNAQVASAQSTATKRIREYLQRLRDYNWKTLKAAVDRGGVFSSTRKIDLPHDLAICFDAAVAERWGDPVLKIIREQTTGFVGACVALLEEVVDWTAARNCPALSEQIASHATRLRGEAENASRVGHDKASGLRERVNRHLVEQIRPPIRERCDQFARSQMAHGKGVHDRLIKLFEELSESVTQAAAVVASKLLGSAIDEVRDTVQELVVVKRPPLDAIEPLAADLTREPTPEAKLRIEQGHRVAQALDRLNHAPTR